MADFITVTFKGKPMMLNVDRIVSYQKLPDTDGCELIIDAPSPVITVNETMSEIRELIRKSSLLH